MHYSNHPRLKKVFKSFEDARDYVRRYKLHNTDDWNIWLKIYRPDDIPSSPWTIYKDQGWKGIPDFCGFKARQGGSKKRQYLSFEKAREYVRTKNIKSKTEWDEWSSSGKRPTNIPSNPRQTYKNNGWIGMPDFCGFIYTKSKTGIVRIFLTFQEACEYVRTLNLQNFTEYKHWSKTNRPGNIPSSPSTVYRDQGWLSFKHYCGWNAQPRIKNFVNFEKAKEIIQSFKLKNYDEYSEWIKTMRPGNVPSTPGVIYKDEGWAGIPDYCGYGKKRKGRKKRNGIRFMPFKKAREYMHSLNLLSSTDWNSWSLSERPVGIPSRPDRVYASDGWISWTDWIGCYHGNLGKQLDSKYKGSEPMFFNRIKKNITKEEPKPEENKEKVENGLEGLIRKNNLMTLKEASDTFDINLKTIQYWTTQSKILPRYKLPGSCYLVKKEDVEQIISTQYPRNEKQVITEKNQEPVTIKEEPIVVNPVQKETCSEPTYIRVVGILINKLDNMQSALIQGTGNAESMNKFLGLLYTIHEDMIELNDETVIYTISQRCPQFAEALELMSEYTVIIKTIQDAIRNIKLR